MERPKYRPQLERSSLGRENVEFSTSQAGLEFVDVDRMTDVDWWTASWKCCREKGGPKYMLQLERSSLKRENVEFSTSQAGLEFVDHADRVRDVDCWTVSWNSCREKGRPTLYRSQFNRCSLRRENQVEFSTSQAKLLEFVDVECMKDVDCSTESWEGCREKGRPNLYSSQLEKSSLRREKVEFGQAELEFVDDVCMQRDVDCSTARWEGCREKGRPTYRSLIERSSLRRGEVEFRTSQARLEYGDIETGNVDCSYIDITDSCREELIVILLKSDFETASPRRPNAQFRISRTRLESRNVCCCKCHTRRVVIVTELIEFVSDNVVSDPQPMPAAERSHSRTEDTSEEIITAVQESTRSVDMTLDRTDNYMCSKRSPCMIVLRRMLIGYLKDGFVQ